MAWVTHPLRFAVAATALVAAGSSTALGQSPAAPTQEPSRPSTPATIFGNLSLIAPLPTDSAKPIFVEAPLRSGVEMTCIGCRGFETTVLRPESADAFAPWALQGTWRRQTPFGLVSTGFVGTRNFGWPLASLMPVGGDVDPASLSTAGASIFPPVTQWSLTAGVEKTLLKRANGSSVGVSGDVLIPFNTDTINAADPRNSALTSPTLRVGIVFRW